MNSFDDESLLKLSYSELKKQAKRKSVKAKMTAEKIRASLLEKSNADEDSFVTLERTILNSCRKNKEALFERDSKRMSETPRRDTYVVDTPLTGTQTINTSIVVASASPELKLSKDESLNVTLSHGSEKKSRKSKRKVSFVTPLRRSTRLSVATPQYSSVKGRPKTPMPSRLSSSTKRVSVVDEGNDSVACTLNLDISETLDTKNSSVGKVKRPSTPMPLAKQIRRKLSSFGDPRCLALTPKVVLHKLKEEDLKAISTKLTTATPVAQPDIEVRKKDTPCAPENKIEVTPMQSSKKVVALTPGFKKIVTPFPASGKPKSICSTPGFKKNVTPFSSSKKATIPKSALTPGLTSSAVRKSPRSNVKSTTTPKLASSAVKKTPNFNKLHQRAFEKMESISDYHQRKLLNSQKKKEEQNKVINVAKSNASKNKTTKVKMLDTFNRVAPKSTSMQLRKRTSLEKLRKAPKMFGGIPFIPSAATTKPMKPNLGLKSEMKTAPSHQLKALNGRSLAKKAIAGNVKAIKSVSRENTPLKQRHKFDLRASLARKLPYKPHTGPLKPLNEINLNNTFAKTPLTTVQKFETKNEVVKKARIQTRDVLHGVRKNKRFMLQMNNRNLDMSVQ